MLDMHTLEFLEEEISERLSTDLPGILIKLNIADKLKAWLELMGMEELLPEQETFFYKPYPTGKIVIVGETKVKRNEIEAIVRSLGINKDRLELCLDYADTKKYNFKKLQYSSNHSLILVGPMPHSATGKDEFSSIIVAMEEADGYPPVKRMGSNGLKISKSGLRVALIEALESGQIEA